MEDADEFVESEIDDEHPSDLENFDSKSIMSSLASHISALGSKRKKTDAGSVSLIAIKARFTESLKNEKDKEIRGLITSMVERQISQAEPEQFKKISSAYTKSVIRDKFPLLVTMRCNPLNTSDEWKVLLSLAPHEAIALCYEQIGRNDVAPTVKTAIIRYFSSIFTKDNFGVKFTTLD
jgi:hypothetical protein